MRHLMVDGSEGSFYRLNQITLVQEVLEHIPKIFDIKLTMPAFLIPYYQGVDLNDCGVSGFIFLNGGHFAIHTFSVRRYFFADMVLPMEFDSGLVLDKLDETFASKHVGYHEVDRMASKPLVDTPDKKLDFGPHILIDATNIEKPKDTEWLDYIYRILHDLPKDIGMEQIMRPYVVRNSEGTYFSGLTMIAESHISFHVFPQKNEAYFDLFSCKFFDVEPVMERIRDLIPGGIVNESVISRGVKYRESASSR